MKSMNSFTVCKIALLLCVIFAAGTVHAQALAWNGTGTTLNSASSWTPNALPAVGDILQFPDAPAMGANKTINNDLTAGFNGTLALGSGYTISGNAFGDLQINGTGPSTLATNIKSVGVNATQLTISGNITGSLSGSSVTLGSVARVTLSGTNSHSGKVEIGGNSTLECGSTGALSPFSALNLSSGALKLNNFNQVIDTGASLAGTTVDLGTATLTIDEGALTVAAGKFSGAITGTGGVTKLGAGITQIEGAQYTGPTVVTGGTLYMQGGFPGSPGTSDVTVNVSGTLRGNGSVRNITCAGTFIPSAPDFSNACTCRDLTFTATGKFRYEVLTAGAAPKVTSTGLVTLANATVEFSLPVGGDNLILIDCPPNTPQDGIFNGLADGDVTLVGTNPYTLNYAKSSNSFDIVLTFGGTVTKPFITSFTPTTGSSGKTVTITGQNLSGATSVTFAGASGQRIAATFSGNTDTSLKAVVPTNAITGTIQVTTAAGLATSTTDFTVKTATTITLTTTSTVGGGVSSATLGVTATLKKSDGTELTQPIEFTNKESLGISYGTGTSGVLFSLSNFAEGEYTVFAIFAGTTELDSSVASVRILVNDVAGGKKIVVVDGNGDGLPDKGNPPSGFTPGMAQADGSLDIGSFSASGAVPPDGQLSRAFVPNKDSLKFKGVFSVSPGFASGAGLALIVAVGPNGVVKFFTIDSKGKSTPKGNDNFQIIGKPKNGKIAFSASFTKGSFIGDLTDAGYPIGTADIPSASENIQFGIYASFGTYLTTEKTDYSVTKGKFKAKLAKK